MAVILNVIQNGVCGQNVLKFVNSKKKIMTDLTNCKFQLELKIFEVN